MMECQEQEGFQKTVCYSYNKKPKKIQPLFKSKSLYSMKEMILLVVQVTTPLLPKSTRQHNASARFSFSGCRLFCMLESTARGECISSYPGILGLLQLLHSLNLCLLIHLLKYFDFPLYRFWSIFLFTSFLFQLFLLFLCSWDCWLSVSQDRPSKSRFRRNRWCCFN